MWWVLHKTPPLSLVLPRMAKCEHRAAREPRARSEMKKIVQGVGRPAKDDEDKGGTAAKEGGRGLENESRGRPHVR